MNQEFINQGLNEEFTGVLDSLAVKEKNSDLKSKEEKKRNKSKSPSKYSSSSGGEVEHKKLLGKKRPAYKDENEEFICKLIYENKNSSPSLILLSKIIEEFTYGLVLDTLLKNILSQGV